MINMGKTYTPELTPEVLDRLEDYANVFRDDFSGQSQATWSGVHLQGLLPEREDGAGWCPDWDDGIGCDAGPRPLTPFTAAVLPLVASRRRPSR